MRTLFKNTLALVFISLWLITIAAGVIGYVYLQAEDTPVVETPSYNMDYIKMAEDLEIKANKAETDAETLLKYLMLNDYIKFKELAMDYRE